MRAVIVSGLERRHGAKWFKMGLPPDLLQKYKDGISWERKIKWQELRPHHPLFYLDFPDLKKIIDKKDNWTEVFGPIFSDKQQFIALLSSLDVVRNRVAHNRYLSIQDLQRLQVFRDMLAASLRNVSLPGASIFWAPDSLPSAISKLRLCVGSVWDKIQNCQVITGLDLESATRSAWWFDEDYLGSSVASTEKFFRKIQEYSDLPRIRGTGYLIERWVLEESVCDLHTECIAELDQILEG